MPLRLRLQIHTLPTLVLLLAAASADSHAAQTPEQVAQTYIGALRAQRWETMASLMHPEALSQLRDLLGPLFEAPSMSSAREQLLGVRTVAEARALSDSGVFVAFISRSMKSEAQIGDVLRDSNIQLIGHVPEGKDTVHVVYRMVFFVDNVASFSKMDLFSLKRLGSTWRGLLTGDLRPLAAMLRRQARS
jgi:hypothetical protein